MLQGASQDILENQLEERYIPEVNASHSTSNEVLEFEQIAEADLHDESTPKRTVSEIEDDESMESEESCHNFNGTPERNFAFTGEDKNVSHQNVSPRQIENPSTEVSRGFGSNSLKTRPKREICPPNNLSDHTYVQKKSSNQCFS